MSIINDILELSRIEAGTVTFSPVQFTIDGCLNEVLDIVYGRAWYVFRPPNPNPNPRQTPHPAPPP